MNASFAYHDFKLVIRPSDHQVRFIADGIDLIDQFWSGMIGLDPDPLLLDPCTLKADATPHLASVARCSCGEVSCGSLDVEIRKVAKRVVWTERFRQRVFSFDAVVYDAEVSRVIADTTWETPDRTAARLLRAAVNREALLLHNLTFRWSSRRLHPDKFTISLNLDPGPYQVLIDVPWDQETPEEIVLRCIALLSDAPSSWPDATWNPQSAGLPRPSIAGPGWRGRAS